MAESFTRAAEDELTCPICLDIFTKPKILPGCAHVCCEDCLKQLIGTERSLNCPECRQAIQITKDGVTELKTNFRLRNLAEKHPRDMPLQKPIGKYDVAMCSVHEEEKMHLYCVTCNALACQFCLLEKHIGKRHDIVGIKDRYNEQKLQMDEIMIKTSDKIRKGREAAEKIKHFIKNVEDSQNREEEKINDFIQQEVDKLIEHGKTLREELRQAGESKLTDLRKQLSSIEQELKNAESVHDAIVNSIASVPKYTYVKEHDVLTSKLQTLHLEIPDVTPTSSPVPQFVCDTSDSSVKGRIVSDINLTQTKLYHLQTFGKYACATSIASFPNGMLALCQFEDIFLYSKQNEQYTEKCTGRVNVASSRNTEYPSDLTICSDSRLLLARTNGIEVYTPDGMYVKTISTIENQCCMLNWLNVCCVATTTDGKILAADSKRSVITVHESTGSIIKTLNTFTKPKKVAVIEDTYVAIAGSDSMSIVNMSSGQQSCSFSVPCVEGVAYVNGRLLISRVLVLEAPDRLRLGTGVIEEYCPSTGRFIGCLAEGLWRPLDITITPDGKVAVADMKTVKVYQFS